jgi:hypothetical protein
MAKKNFKNLDNEDSNSKDTLSILIDSANNPKAEMQVKRVEKTKGIKTLEMYNNDYAYLQRYARVMATRNDTKFPLREAITDAVKLLQAENPDIPID